MVFGNIFNFADNSAGLFSVTTNKEKPQPAADVDDFEDVDDDAYDDKSTSLYNNAIHGASFRAKVVREQSPEARAVLGFLGSFIQTTQQSAGTQATYAQNPGSVSTAAAGGMHKASETVTEHEGLKKNEDLESKPKKSDYTKPPKAPEAPKAAEPGKAPKAGAEKPSRSESE
ncbi:hypothetical protein [Streptomyces violaceus]|uniref:Uncharacterized protein n=1 Tax=Streptomyces violaceus TaxID=1936 RepID=A0ABY9ULQ4_STRVL|nr:hypothetical protein [Streptomyces janthinus]WND23172.1 hypothetical protein RI060_40125 [Streptomyces janthinus]GGS56346.1 hypothetical protein GCM10010270_28710 [Streptomyces janthinus]